MPHLSLSSQSLCAYRTHSNSRAGDTYADMMTTAVCVRVYLSDAVSMRLVEHTVIRHAVHAQRNTRARMCHAVRVAPTATQAIGSGIDRARGNDGVAATLGRSAQRTGGHSRCIYSLKSAAVSMTVRNDNHTTAHTHARRHATYVRTPEHWHGPPTHIPPAHDRGASLMRVHTRRLPPHVLQECRAVAGGALVSREWHSGSEHRSEQRGCD